MVILKLYCRFILLEEDIHVIMTVKDILLSKYPKEICNYVDEWTGQNGLR